MKTAEYKLPFGVHPALEPVETGRTEPVKDKSGQVILHSDGKPGRPIYAYKVVTTPEPESLAEFMATQVEQDKPEDHTLSLAQAQLDIIRQRKIREWFQSQECSDMLDGKTADTKGLSDDQRVAFVLQYGQDVGNEYRYGSRPAATGGGNAAAKAALAKQNAIAEAAAKDPKVAKKLAELERTLAELGVTL